MNLYGKQLAPAGACPQTTAKLAWKNIQLASLGKLRSSLQTHLSGSMSVFHMYTFLAEAILFSLCIRIFPRIFFFQKFFIFFLNFFIANPKINYRVVETHEINHVVV